MKILLTLLHEFQLLCLGSKPLHVINGFEINILGTFHVLKRLLKTPF